MEAYRISSKLREQDREYLIQTVNDVSLGTVTTTVFVDGVQTDTVNRPHPTEMDAQEVLSLVKETHGERRKEMESLLRAYQHVVNQGDSGLIYSLGVGFFSRRFFLEAAELFEAVTQLNPDHHQAYNHLGMACLALGRTGRAVEAATAAVEHRPGYADYRNNLGEAYLADNSAELAIPEFEQALGINMYYGDAYFNLGLAHILDAMTSPDRARASMKITKVTECLHKASLITPDFKRLGDFGGGVQALKDGDFSRALGLFKGIREAWKESRRRESIPLGTCLVYHPDWATDAAISDQIKSLESELRKNPNYVDLQAELARSYLEYSRLLWNKGVDRFSRTAEANRSLDGVSYALEEAEKVQQRIDVAIGKIAEKG